MIDNDSPEGLGPESSLRPERSVMMPTREVMVEKLQQARLLGMTPQSDKFFNQHVDSIANSPKVAAGLNLAWELVMYDTLNDYPAVIQAAMSLYYDDVVDAITPDSEVASQAKIVRRQMLEKLEKRQGA